MIDKVSYSSHTHRSSTREATKKDKNNDIGVACCFLAHTSSCRRPPHQNPRDKLQAICQNEHNC